MNSPLLKLPVIIVKTIYSRLKNDVNFRRKMSKSELLIFSSLTFKRFNSAIPKSNAKIPIRLITVLEIFEIYSASSSIVSLVSNPKNKTKLITAIAIIRSPPMVPLRVCVKSLFMKHLNGCGFRILFIPLSFSFDLI